MSLIDVILFDVLFTFITLMLFCTYLDLFFVRNKFTWN